MSLTITQLREELDRLEEKWDDGWVEFFGPFGNQEVLVDCYDNQPNKAMRYTGIGPAMVYPYWELGLCIFPEVEETNEERTCA